jgi:6-phosphogluconolactonase
VEADRVTPEVPGLRVFPNARSLVRAAAAEVLRRGRRAVRERGTFHLALAGGTTPMALYQALGSRRAASAPFWRHTHLYWGDERVVPSEDPASNYGVAWKVGLHRLHVPAANVHRVRGESDNPRRAAIQYESELRSRFAGALWPAFDLVLLGLGADGHTASLFPGSDALAERERWTEVAEGGEPRTPRVTLTLPALNGAAAVLFLVTGASKAAALSRLLGPSGEDPLPAQRVHPRGQRLVFADRAAMGQPPG